MLYRSDANIISGQNLKPSVIYHYSKPFSKIDQDKTEPMPGKGEIEERFNPRPYFEYIHKAQSSSGGDSSPPKPSSSGVSVDDSKPSITYGSPFDSFPVFTKTEDAKPTSGSSGNGGGGDIYDSPYSSYNPPSKPDDMKDDSDDDGSYKFPPLAPPPSANGYKDADVYQSSPESNGDKKKPMANVYDMPPINGYLPPPAPYGNIKPPLEDDSDSYKPPNKSNKHPPMKDDGDGDDDDSQPPPPSMHGDAFPGPYAYLPSYDADSEPGHGKPSGSSYLPSGHDHMNGDSNAGPPISYTVEPPNDVHSSYLDHPPHGYDDHQYHHHAPASAPAAPPPPPPPPVQPSMAEGDLTPPADAGGYGQLPQYLDHDPKGHGYDFYGYDHHPPVYHEVEHPTTTEAMEDQRVNKHHYSYYYLGRKLWYIPLYFSIYFIIYVTILILKSIARHKVQLKHHHHDKYRKSRTLEIDDIHRNVSHAIETATQRFMFM